MGLWQDAKAWMGFGRAAAQPALMPVVPAEPLPSGKPKILISAQSASSASLAAAIKMVEAQGAEAVTITTHAGRDPAQDLIGKSGVLMLGGDGDIDPGRYGQVKDAATKSELDPALGAESAARSAYEEALMRSALSNQVPLLAVCLNAQRLNTIHNVPPNGIKGTLFQDLAPVIGHDAAEQHDQRNAGIAASVPVTSVHLTDGILKDIAQGADLLYAPRPGGKPGEPTEFMENSFHHQAIDKVGLGFVEAAQYAETFTDPRTGQTRHLTAAIAPDPNGPYANQFAIGVQWHPEFSASPFGAKLFSAFVGAALEKQQQAETNVAALESAFGTPSTRVQSILANGPRSISTTLRPPVPGFQSPLTGAAPRPSLFQR